MAVIPSTLTIKIPLHAEFKGIYYHVGDVDVPVGIKTEFRENNWLEITRKVDPQSMTEQFRKALQDVSTSASQSGRAQTWLTGQTKIGDGPLQTPEFKPGDEVKIIGPPIWDHIEKLSDGIIGKALPLDSYPPVIPRSSVFIEFDLPGSDHPRRRWFFPPTSLAPVVDDLPPSRIVPDYSLDSLLVDLVARIRYEQGREFIRVRGHGSDEWESWDDVDEGVRSAWRVTSEAKLKELIGHGRESAGASGEAARGADQEERAR